jgi:hypothetical protein
MKSLIISLILVTLSLGLAEGRTWKSAEGRTLEAAQWRIDGDRIVFVINGKEVPYDIAKLAPEEQAFAKQWEKDHPNPAPAASQAPGKPVSKTAKGAAPARAPVKRENGDVVIENLPMPVVEESVADWNPVAFGSILNAYYGWNADVVAIAKKNKWDPESDHWDFEDGFYRDLGRAGNTKVSLETAFDFDALVKQIDRGQPMIHWRGWSEQREAKYIEFEKQLRSDPSAQLPPANDPKEKRLWITDPGGSSAISCMTIGYNKQRGEVLMASPYRGEDQKLFRMRKEEMKAVGYSFFFFEPK